MKSARIAIIGETSISPDGTLTRSGAIATKLAAVDGTSVTLRTVVASERDRQILHDVLVTYRIIDQITVRDDGSPVAIRNGDVLDIWGLFDHDVVVLDFDDAPLRHFLTDLPAHTKPDVQLLGTLRYAQKPFGQEEFEIALRFDTIVGTSDQVRLLTAAPDPDAGLFAIHDRMRGSNLRSAVMMTEDGTIAIATPGDTIRTLSSSLQFAAAVATIALGMARRDDRDAISDALCRV